MERVVSAVVFISLFAVIDLVIGEPFTVYCRLAFESLKEDRQIDHLCAARGNMPLSGGSDQDRAHAGVEMPPAYILSDAISIQEPTILEQKR